MFTSCGWFFDEISGLEPVQILRHAALALAYLRDLGASDLEPELLRRLAAAPSNVAEYGDGAGVYRRLVSPAVVEPARVIAHYAITGLFEEHGDDARVYAYRVARLDEAREADGATALRVGHVRLRSEITGDTRETSYALLHLGGREVTCAVRAEDGLSSYDTMKADLRRRYASGNLPEVARGFDEHFPGERYGLPHLFPEERRRLLACLPEDASGLRDAVRGALGAVEDEPSRERVAEAVALVEAAGRLGLGFGHWTAQNRFFALWRARPDSHAVLLPLAAALGFDLGDPRC
jgi:hypothetical protein